MSIKGNNACTGGYLGLGGIISPAFSNLTSLVKLTLAGNNLTHSIPHSLTTLPQLQLLDVSDNNLTGQVPKFPSKVKLNTTDNALLGLNMSRPTHRPVWIAGMFQHPLLYISILF